MENINKINIAEIYVNQHFSGWHFAAIERVRKSNTKELEKSGNSKYLSDLLDNGCIVPQTYHRYLSLVGLPHDPAMANAKIKSA